MGSIKNQFFDDFHYPSAFARRTMQQVLLNVMEAALSGMDSPKAVIDIFNL
jgi:hypothetical protein